MELMQLFRSVMDQDRAPVVICDLNHTILYMNAVAGERYAPQGGMDLVGKSLKNCHSPRANEAIDRVLAWFSADPEHNMVYTFRNNEENKDVYMVALRDQDGTLVGYYEKHEYRTNETMKLYDLF